MYIFGTEPVFDHRRILDGRGYDFAEEEKRSPGLIFKFLPLLRMRRGGQGYFSNFSRC